MVHQWFAKVCLFEVAAKIEIIYACLHQLMVEVPIVEEPRQGENLDLFRHDLQISHINWRDVEAKLPNEVGLVQSQL